MNPNVPINMQQVPVFENLLSYTLFKFGVSEM